MMRMATELHGNDGICSGCTRAREKSSSIVFCLLFGIMISRKHRGCKYFIGGEHEQVRKPEDDDVRTDLRQ